MPYHPEMLTGGKQGGTLRGKDTSSIRCTYSLTYLDNFRLRRGLDGFFADDDLAKVLHDATGSVSQLPAAGVPACMRWSEIEMIKQARESTSYCTINDYREYLGLRRTHPP